MTEDELFARRPMGMRMAMVVLSVPLAMQWAKQQWQLQALDVAYKGAKEPALFGFYEDECKAVHKRVDAILEAAGVELVGDDTEPFHLVEKCQDSF